MENTEKYVDGFLIPIAKDNVSKYKEIAQKAGEVWKEHGALEYYECIGDDLDVKGWFLSRRQLTPLKEKP